MSNVKHSEQIKKFIGITLKVNDYRRYKIIFYIESLKKIDVFDQKNQKSSGKLESR